MALTWDKLVMFPLPSFPFFLIKPLQPLIYLLSLLHCWQCSGQHSNIFIC